MKVEVSDLLGNTTTILPDVSRIGLIQARINCIWLSGDGVRVVLRGPYVVGGDKPFQCNPCVRVISTPP